jgi:hypothetical protein
MSDNIKAGADIHAGDGGYSIGTKEKYDEFAKGRNQSLSEMRIQALKAQCIVREQRGTTAFDSYMVDRFDTERFAKLIVQDCVQHLVNYGYTDAAKALSEAQLGSEPEWQTYQFPDI